MRRTYSPSKAYTSFCQIRPHFSKRSLSIMLARPLSANIFSIPVDHPDNCALFTRFSASIIPIFSPTSLSQLINTAFYQRVLLPSPHSFRLRSFLSSCYVHSMSKKKYVQHIVRADRYRGPFPARYISGNHIPFFASNVAAAQLRRWTYF